ncbi:MAG: cation-translocating P-type ATPase [Armatimonadota bacterium]|nr:cation-translocating P-type ATPase [Armatimonadota bacterium]
MAHDHDAVAEDAQAEAVFQGRWYAYPPLRNALIAGLIAGSAFALAKAGIVERDIEVRIYAVAIIIGGYLWVIEGLGALLAEGRVEIEALMMAATGGSIALGMWEEAAVLVFLYGAAEGLEHYTYVRTRRSIRNLLDLAPPTARLVRQGQEWVIDAEELEEGDLFNVRPGETIATDGVIIDGRSTVNEAAVTGEAMPAEKQVGDQVFAGTLNREGALTVEATAAFEDNTLSRMIHLVEEAHERKGRRQVFIDRFGRWYTPAVLLAAVLLMAVPAALGGDIDTWATRGVVLLVAAAPCALVMSTPVGIAAGIGRAGRTGVLIKGGAHLEDLGRVRLVAFDKTGTLTEGEPVVTDVVPLDGGSERVLQLAASLEQHSEHPLGEAIVRHADERGLDRLDVEGFRSITGAGVSARLDDRLAYVGSPELCAELGVAQVASDDALRLQGEGKTVVCVTTEDGPVGLIALGDRLRQEAIHAIEDLRAMGIEVVMLTGDNQTTAEAIGREAGIQDVRADLTPEQKTAAVVELTQEHAAVAVVGDGINDAPALAQATVGIAMGVGGSDAAIEAADTALLGDDLTLVPFAIRVGRRALGIGTQNIVFALAVLAVLIPGAVLGLVSVAWAVLIHEASELLAVANGLRVGSRRTLICPQGEAGEGVCVVR